MLSLFSLSFDIFLVNYDFTTFYNFFFMDLRVFLFFCRKITWKHRRQMHDKEKLLYRRHDTPHLTSTVYKVNITLETCVESGNGSLIHRNNAFISLNKINPPQKKSRFNEMHAFSTKFNNSHQKWATFNKMYYFAQNKSLFSPVPNSFLQRKDTFYLIAWFSLENQMGIKTKYKLADFIDLSPPQYNY